MKIDISKVIIIDLSEVKRQQHPVMNHELMLVDAENSEIIKELLVNSQGQ